MDTGEEQAERAVMYARWGGAVGLLGGVAYLWRLTYYELSWDIMEPVTYFIGSSFAIVAYFWWLMSR